MDCDCVSRPFSAFVVHRLDDLSEGRIVLRVDVKLRNLGLKFANSSGTRNTKITPDVYVPAEMLAHE